MRIASIYLPYFPLQAALASAPPTAVGAAIAVIGASGAPVVAACSRAAWAQGVRPGMVASVARTHCAELVCLVRDAVAEDELVRTLADALLVLTPVIDLGGRRGPRPAIARDPAISLNHALFAEVPAGKRGAAFGARVVEVAAGLGLRVRVGIADDRFTAAVAAAHGATAGAKDHHPVDGAVTCVPRGSAAAFLAPLPLGLLAAATGALPAEVQHMLEALGVRTLGAFAELPPPSVARAWDADLQALARGDGGTQLEGYRPAARLRNRIEVGAGGVGAALQRLAERLALRLTGRGSARVEVEVRRAGAAPGAAIELTGPYDADSIADELTRTLGEVLASPRELGTIELHAVAHPDDEDEAPAVAPEVAGSIASAPRGDRAGASLWAEVAPLVLTPVPSVLGHRPEHRRTRRGKQRPRIASGQARLFARET